MKNKHTQYNPKKMKTILIQKQKKSFFKLSLLAMLPLLALVSIKSFSPTQQHISSQLMLKNPFSAPYEEAKETITSMTTKQKVGAALFTVVAVGVVGGLAYLVKQNYERAQVFKYLSITSESERSPFGDVKPETPADKLEALQASWWYPLMTESYFASSLVEVLLPADSEHKEALTDAIKGAYESDVAPAEKAGKIVEAVNGLSFSLTATLTQSKKEAAALETDSEDNEQSS